MVNIRGIFLVALMLSGVVSLSATTLKQFYSAGHPKAGMAAPYGYNLSSVGAGDQSFQWCLDLVSTNMVKPRVTSSMERRRPLIIICGKDGCGLCSSFANMVNDNLRGMPSSFGYLKITTAYFRGKDNGTEPVACAQARAFVKEKFKENVDPCHRVYVYGVYEDGTEYLGKIGSIPMTPNGYGGAIVAQVNRFDNDYDKHLYKPPAANAEFTVEDGWLEAMPEMKKVYVPFTRTNNVACVETNRLVATFPGNSAVTNDVAWAANRTSVEVAVERPEETRVWGDVGARIRLELLSTNGVSVATNFVTCVAATNSLLLPSLDTNRLESAEMNPWGVWTLLEGDATNHLPGAVSEANGHFVTHDTPTPISHEASASFDVTNRLTVVTTNDLSAFASFDAASWTDLTNLVARGSVYVDAGNTLCATNDLVAWTNAVAKGGAALRPQTRTVALDTVTITNFVAGEEALKPVETFTATTTIEATNELRGVFGVLDTTNAVAFPFAVAVALPATNVVSALADGEHPADTASTNATPVAFFVTVLTASRTLEAVRVGSEAARDPDGGDAPVEQRHEHVWTDPAFTTNLVDGTTAAYIAKNATQTNVVACAVTNTTYLVFGGENGATSADDPAVARCPFTYTLTTNYYDVTLDQRAGEDIQAFQLRVTGGLVWDAHVRALADTFDSKEFKDWCALSNVVCTVIDQRNAATGASLFTHVQATNGMRGTRFLSRNGLSEKENGARSSEGDTFKVELIRPDGTTEDGEKVYENGVQKATGQIVWSTTDPARFDTVAKARATLTGAIDLAKNDPTENLNDDPATTPLTLAFDTVTSQTLSALDTVDVFRLTGAYTNTAVAFTLTNKTNDAVLSFAVCDEAGMEIPPTFDAAESTNRVWVFKADDAVFVKVFTTNALSGTVASYAVGATNAPPCPGTVGFKVTEAEVEEGVVTNVADNAFAFLRTEGTINYFGLAVRRTGYTGAASCTVSLDEDAIPEDMREDVRKRIVWENQKLTWNDLECGETNVVIGLVNDKDWYADVKLTFNLEGDGVEVREGDGSFTLTYKDRSPMKPGKLAIDKENMTGDAFRAAGDGKFYARAGTSLDIPVNRNDASCSNVTGRLVVVTSGVGIKITDPDSGEDISETGLVWEDRESDPKTFSVGLPKEVKPGSKGHQEIKLELKGDHVDPKSNSVTICVLPANAPGWNDTSPDGECSPDEKTTWTGVQYTKFEDSVELAGDGDLVSHKPERISGAVPAGLTVTLDKVTRQLVVSGIPTAPTATNGVTLVCQAKTEVGGKTVWTLPVTLHITIRALADVNANFAGDGAKSKTVWTGLALLDKDKTAVEAGEPARLRGLLDLTVSSKGRTSAKWRTVEGKTVSFSAAGFAGIGETSRDVRLGATRVVAGVTNTLTATLRAEGGLDVAIASNGVGVAFGPMPADAAAWSKDHPATNYVGTYVAAFPVDTNWVETVAGGTFPLCSGAATLTFRLAAGAARTGRTTFAGVLPNGRTFSGSATLAGNAALPVLAASATDAFAAVLDIAKEDEVVAAEGTEPFWAHRERNFASLSYDPALISVGARWTAPDKDAELPLDVQTPGEDGVVRLRLNRTSGVVQGAVRVRNTETDRLETHTARGVLIPWGEEDFALFGARWWNEVQGAERDDGTTVRKTVRVGEPLGE